jgi:hypothetical protein
VDDQNQSPAEQGRQMNIEIRGMADLQRRLEALAIDRFPNAVKAVVNEVAKAGWNKTREEMRSTFDRPTPRTLAAFSISQWATTQNPVAVLDFNRYYQNAITNPIENTIKPHVPGFSNLRARKGAELWLQNAGLIRVGEYLVPSRTCPLDQYGNVRGPLMQKMLADVGAYRNASGFDGTTINGSYLWGEVRGRNGQKVKGIWKIQGGNRNASRGRWSLMMVVVRRAPLYRKRFDIETIVQREVSAKLPIAVDSYIRRALAQR